MHTGGRGVNCLNPFAIWLTDMGRCVRFCKSSLLDFPGRVTKGTAAGQTGGNDSFLVSDYPPSSVPSL